jgi:putative N6-adenine-specific DNA methylase
VPADPLDFFAACSLGLEPALAEELRGLEALGGGPVLDIDLRRGGVAFRGDRQTGYAANLWLRSAVRVQEELWNGTATTTDALYEQVRKLDWDRWLRPAQTFAVLATARDSQLGDPRFCALRVKDAVVDAQRDRHGKRSNVDPRRPDVPLKLVVQREQVRLYRDWSGVSLHRRGWRPIQVKAPLNEATAAGLILLSDWDRKSPIADPMCGSGTFVIEAAQIAARRAPGLGRSFAFEGWPDSDRRLWDEVREAARDAAHPSVGFPLVGADHHPGAIALAKRGAADAGIGGLVQFTACSAREWTPPLPPAAVFVNPPYGERLEGDDAAALADAWSALGNFLHQQCGGATAWVLCGNKALTRHLGLRTNRRIPVRNGPIECRWLRYEVRAKTSGGAGPGIGREAG